MNSYYKITEKLKELCKAQNIVKTVIHGKSEDKDIYKKNIYPLAHIMPISSDMTSSQVNRFVFDLAVLDVRDISKYDDESKFEGNDNQQDNLNTTYAVINYVITHLRLQDNDFIELTNVGSVDAVLFQSLNLLDGWVVRFTIETKNDIISVC